VCKGTKDIQRRIRVEFKIVVLKVMGRKKLIF